MRSRTLFFGVLILGVFLAGTTWAQLERNVPQSGKETAITIPDDEDDNDEINQENAAYLSYQTEVADREPPQIIFTPVTRAASGQKLTIQAQITDNRQVRVAKLFYRDADRSDFSPGIPLLPISRGGDVYQADLPVNNQDIYYYIEAVDSDNNGPVRVGPFHLAVSKVSAPKKKEAASAAAKGSMAGGPNYFILFLLIIAIIGILITIVLMLRQGNS